MALVELEIPPRSPYVAVVRLAIAALARSAGVDEESVDDLKIAVSEACANAVLSSEDAGSDDPVAVTWEERDDALIVEVSNGGKPYHSSSEPELDTQGLSSRLAMSIALLESLVSRCEFSDSSTGGTMARLVIERQSDK